MNHKLGGDLKKIQTVGKYMVEVWKAIGMDMEKVQFISSSEEINKHASEYWPLVLDIATKNNRVNSKMAIEKPEPAILGTTTYRGEALACFPVLALLGPSAFPSFS